MLCAWQASFVGAMAIADLVKTTLGPKGMVRACNFQICLSVRPGQGSSAKYMLQSDVQE